MNAPETPDESAPETPDEGASELAEASTELVEAITGRVSPAIAAVPGIARVVGAAAWHTTTWGVRTSVRTSTRIAHAVVDTDERDALAKDAADLLDLVSDTARASARAAARASGSEASGAHGRAGQPEGQGVRRRPPARAKTRPNPPEDTPAMLRRRGAELLDRSRNVWAEEQGHPAYSRILDELAPDEARILLVLLRDGPQPTVDIRTGGPSSLTGGHPVASGLTMVGSRAGVRYSERVPAYLTNLARLGLLRFAKEPVADPTEYQVLEAQPDVLEAMHSVRFAKVVRRGMRLTPFGEGFARMCLDEDGHPAEPAEPAATPGSGEIGPVSP